MDSQYILHQVFCKVWGIRLHIYFRENSQGIFDLKPFDYYDIADRIYLHKKLRCKFPLLEYLIQDIIRFANNLENLAHSF